MLAMNGLGSVDRVAVAALLIVFATGCSAPVPSISPTTVPTSVATASNAPTTPSTAGPTATSKPPPTTGWTPIMGVTSRSDVEFLDVVWIGTRFVAIGWEFRGGGGAVLDSSDGLTWHRQPSGPADAANLVALAAGPRGVVAVGEIDERFSSWVSEDGLTWAGRTEAFVPFDPEADTFMLVDDVFATDDGWLAVGSEHPVCLEDCAFSPIRAIVWTSTDGLEWTRVLDQPALEGGAMSQVTHGGPGYVAVGSAGNHAAVWTSIDSRVWTRVPDGAQFHTPAGEDPQAPVLMSRVDAAGGQLIATGYVGEPDGGFPIVWWSADGTAWSVTRKSGFGGFGTFVSTPGGYLMVGEAGDHGCPSGGIWSSDDGTFQEMIAASTGSEWPCFPSDPVSIDLNVTGAAASPERLVLVGAAEESEAPVIWVHELE